MMLEVSGGALPETVTVVVRKNGDDCDAARAECPHAPDAHSEGVPCPDQNWTEFPPEGSFWLFRSMMIRQIYTLIEHAGWQLWTATTASTGSTYIKLRRGLDVVLVRISDHRSVGYRPDNRGKWQFRLGCSRVHLRHFWKRLNATPITE